MRERQIGGYSVIIFNGTEYDQDDGWYYQISETTQADNVVYAEPEGPFPTGYDAESAAIGAIRNQEDKSMANENERGFAIACPDELWVTGLIEVGGKWRWTLGLKEERTVYPTREAAQLELDRMAPGEEGYEIVISDDLPAEKRPAFLLRFPDADEKALAEKWAERMGYPSLTAYILEAVTDYNQKWREHTGYEDQRTEASA